MLLYTKLFSDGAIIADSQTLIDVAESIFINSEPAQKMLALNGYNQAVTADIDGARLCGIQSVPFFLFDGKYGAS